MRYILVPTLLILLFAPSISAEEIRLKDGTLLRGSIAAVNDSHSEYYFIHEDKTISPQWISMTEIKSIRYDAVPVVEKSTAPECKAS